MNKKKVDPEVRQVGIYSYKIECIKKNLAIKARKRKVKKMTSLFRS